jgi:hypothetical protein
VKERSNHETEEAKSAITYRYQHATEAEELIDMVSKAVNSTNSSTDSPCDDSSTSTTKLKASMVNEITRIMSAALTTTAKLDSAGVERLARWRNAGIVTEDLSNATLTVDSARPTRSALQSREIYQPLTARLPAFRFATGGISSLHPLKRGSWVLVGFKNRLWLGNGESASYLLLSHLSPDPFGWPPPVKILYLTGGVQKATHNYADICSDITSLSRLVVAIYTEYGAYLSPLVCKPTGAFRESPSFLFLHQEHLVISLDSLCPNPVETTSIPLQHGLPLLKPRTQLLEFLSQAKSVAGDIIRNVNSLLKLAASRPKRAADNLVSEGVCPPKKKRKMYQ